MGKREDILDATLDLILDEGLQSVTFSKIFSRANVGAGTCYNYFRNKEELVAAIYERAIGHLGDVVTGGGTADGTVYERLRRVLRNIAGFARDFPRELRFLEEFADSPFISKEIRELNNRAMQESLGIVRDGQAQGLIREMNEVLCVEILYGGMLSAMKGAMLGKYPMGEHEIAQVIETCWRAIKV